MGYRLKNALSVAARTCTVISVANYSRLIKKSSVQRERVGCPGLFTVISQVFSQSAGGAL